jgi:glycosyltransferase involved in cell wall biosynthesis
MTSLTVTIITVCRNASTTIEKTLLSVQQQSHPDIQHIVIDGASTDGTQEIVSKGLRVGGVLRSEADKGIYNAMNKGIALATGDIIAFLNADDMYAHSDVVKNVLANLQSAPDTNTIFGDVAFYNKDTPGQFYRRYNSGIFRPWLLRWGWMPAHPGMFMTRVCYEEIGPFKENYEIAADYEFITRGFSKKIIRYRYLKDIFVYMLPGGASTENVAARMTINRETVKACRENGIYTNLAMVMTKYPLKLIGYLR